VRRFSDPRGPRVAALGDWIAEAHRAGIPTATTGGSSTVQLPGPTLIVLCSAQWWVSTPPGDSVMPEGLNE